MVQLYSWLHYTLKELSNNTSHAQIRVQMKKLCHQQIGEENKLCSRFCRDRANDKAFLRQNPDFIATELVTNSVTTKPIFFRNGVSNKLCRYKTRFCRNRVSNKLCRDKTIFCHDRANDKAFLLQNPDFVATELATNFVATKPDFVATE